MTSFLNRIFSTSSQIKQERTIQKEPKPLKEIHKKINVVVDNAKKELAKISEDSERFLQSIKDFGEKCALKNQRNIMLYLLECDFKKEKIKPNDIKTAVKYCAKRSEAGNLGEKEQKQICAFFEKIASLPQEQFDRPALLGHKTALQRLLSPELNALMEAQEKDPALTANTQHQLKMSIAKAKLSVQLGFGVSNAGNGVNGAQIIKDLENKPVGVFKGRPDIKWYQIGEHMKKYFGQARLLNQNEMCQQFAEVAAHQFDEIMGFKLAPAATMVEMKNREGAFLAFLGGYKELKDCEKTLEARTSYDKAERIKWQLMCLANYVKANLDPHNENIFVKLDKDNKIIDIRVIDHGNCFVEHNPDAWGAKGNLGKWGDYKQSLPQFEPEILEFIRNSLTEKNLDQFVANIGKEKQNFWTTHMDTLQRDRLRILRECVLSGQIKSPAELACIRTQQDYSTHLKHSAQSIVAKEEATEIGGFAVLDIN